LPYNYCIKSAKEFGFCPTTFTVYNHTKKNVIGEQILKSHACTDIFSVRRRISTYGGGSEEEDT
jgi:hypothetical protein